MVPRHVLVVTVVQRRGLLREHSRNLRGVAKSQAKFLVVPSHVKIMEEIREGKYHGPSKHHSSLVDKTVSITAEKLRQNFI